MSKRMTRADVRSFARAVGKPIFYTGYCELQSLVSRWKKIGYNSGVYGWNWDCFNFPDFVLVTGYRNLIGTRMKHCKKFNELAFNIFESEEIVDIDNELMKIAHELFLAQKED